MKKTLLLILILLLGLGTAFAQSKKVIIKKGKYRDSRMVDKHKSDKPEPIDFKYIEYPKLTGTNIADLDGDGEQDTITYELIVRNTDKIGRKYGNHFNLYINSVNFYGNGSALRDYYKIVDIDTSDNFLEIVVFDNGEDATRVYIGYNGQDIIRLGRFSGWKHDGIDGSGILKVGRRGFQNYYPHFYKLSKDHKLEHIEQDMYFSNSNLVMKDSLALQLSRTDTTTVIVLLPGEKVTLLWTNDKKWFFVEGQRGIRGWFNRIIFKERNKYLTDIFYGLNTAD